SKEWDKSIGGNSWDELYSLQQSRDGGYILGGYSISPISGDKTEPSRGFLNNDYWVVKLDADGSIEWDKTLGGSSRDELLTSLKQTNDGSYILGGYSGSDKSEDKSEDSK